MTENTENWRPSNADTLEAGVAQALGAASMAWDPTPTGVFVSEQAKGVADGLVAWMEDEGYATTDALTPEGWRLWAFQEAAKTMRAGTLFSQGGLENPWPVISVADWILYGTQDAEVTEETTVEVDGLERIDVGRLYFGAAGLIVDRDALASIHADFHRREDTSVLQDVVDTLEALGLKVEG